MNTVIQELIDELCELSNDYYKLSEYDTCHGIGIAVEFIITKLEKEKEQIIESYCDGFVEGSEGNKIMSEEYYIKNYGKA